MVWIYNVFSIILTQLSPLRNQVFNVSLNPFLKKRLLSLLGRLRQRLSLYLSDIKSERDCSNYLVLRRYQGNCVKTTWLMYIWSKDSSKRIYNEFLDWCSWIFHLIYLLWTTFTFIGISFIFTQDRELIL